MEPVGSLPHSRVPATCLYPEPAQSSPYAHILLLEDPTYSSSQYESHRNEAYFMLLCQMQSVKAESQPFPCHVYSWPFLYACLMPFCFNASCHFSYFVLCNFRFNALWRVTHSNTAGRVWMSRHITKLGGCAHTANYISHCALAS
jgi:hypothetical protein